MVPEAGTQAPCPRVDERFRRGLLRLVPRAYAKTPGLASAERLALGKGLSSGSGTEAYVAVQEIGSSPNCIVGRPTASEIASPSVASFVAPDMGLHELRWDQLDRVAQGLQLTGPAMCPAARLYANETGRPVGEEHDDLLAFPLLAKHRLAVFVCTVYLEHVWPSRFRLSQSAWWTLLPHRVLADTSKAQRCRRRVGRPCHC